MKSREQRSILVVEDSHEDFEALQWACSSIDIPLIRCEDGEKAIRYLTEPGESGYPVQLPGIVLLDLNLPRMGGRDVLRYLKSSDTLKKLPVVIFSSSSNPREIEGCYRDGANTYIAKPLGIQHLRELMECLVRYWFQHAILADRGPNGTGS